MWYHIRQTALRNSFFAMFIATQWVLLRDRPYVTQNLLQYLIKIVTSYSSLMFWVEFYLQWFIIGQNEKCPETLRALIETNSDHLQSNQDINPMLQWWRWFRYLGWYSTSKWPETISQSVSFLPPVDLLFWLQDASSDIESWLWLMSSNTNTSEDAPI